MPLDIQMNATTISLAVGVGVISLYFVYNAFFNNDDTEEYGKPLNPKEYQKYKLTKITTITHNTTLFRFGLQTPDTVLGLPVGKHISFRFFDAKNEEIRRSYTPVSSDDETGYFDMLIKVYEKGNMTQHLAKLSVGDYIEARGPLGKIHYSEAGHFKVEKRVNNFDEFNVKTICMIAGGTGITPMTQIMRQIIKDSNDNTDVRLIFGNVTVDDILLKDELQTMRQENDNMSVYFTLDKPPKDWKEGSGYITETMIKSQFPEPSDDVVVLLCGPDIMVKLCKKACENLKYPKIFSF